MDSEGSIEHVLPELVRDSELKETVIDGDYTIHRQPISLRTRSRNDTWIRETKLGRGGYGEVWLEKKVHGDASLPRLRAVKRMHFPENETIFQFNRGRYVRELEALAKFSQDKYKDFFVRSYGWYIARGYLNIAMEYCPLSDLKAYLERVKTIPTQEVHEIAIQVLEALTWMHRNEFAHRDLKPANILIQAHPPEEWWVKLCDFGLSKREEAAAESSTVRGTPSFMAPEAIGFPFAGDPKKASPYLTDMWCFGETLFRCHTGQAAFEDREQLYKYQQDSNLFPSGPLRRVRASALAIDFIWSIMWPDPSERCDTKAARRHPWVRVQDKPLPGTVSQTKTESPPQQTGVEQRSTGPPAEAPEVRVDSELTDASGQWSITATSTNHVRNEPLANGYNQDHPENRNRPQPSLLASSKHDRVPYSKTIAPSNKDQSASRNEERNVTLADHVKARRGYYQLEEEPDSPRQATPRAESGNTSDAHDDDGGDDSDDAWEVLESSDADDESYSVTATPSRRSSATPHTRGKRTDHHDTSYAVDATPSREPRPRDTKEAGIKRTDRTKSAKTSSEARKEKIRSPQSKD
ncbi:Protein kinase-like domain containing protein [Naviculisporaceae sp. PSN 640]